MLEYHQEYVNLFENISRIKPKPAKAKHDNFCKRPEKPRDNQTFMSEII